MKYFWPRLDDIKEAHKACGAAAGMAFFIAILTGVITWLQTTGKINFFPGLKELAYIDVVLFIAIGIGLSFHSRVAALAGLLLYIAERYFMISTYGFRASQATAIIIFGLSFVNGVRGAFAWHEFKSLENPGAPGITIPENIEAAPKRVFPVRTILLLVILLVVAGGAYFYSTHKFEMPKFDFLKQKTQSVAKAVTPKKVSAPLIAPQGEAVKLTLKSGRVFEGILIKKNSEGYWVFVDGTGEIYFSAKEVEAVS